MSVQKVGTMGVTALCFDRNKEYIFSCPTSYNQLEARTPQIDCAYRAKWSR